MRAARVSITLAAGALVFAPEAMESAPERAAPLLVAHRGLLRHAPENTLAALSASLSLRLGFETDLQRTRDGRLVCLHDTTVDRTTDGSGPIADLTLAQVRRLDAGAWFGPAFRGERVPTLDEVFALVARKGQPETVAALDFKAGDPTIERDMIALARKHRVLDRVLAIGSPISRPEVRRRLRSADRRAHVACLAQTEAELPAALADRDSDWAYLRFVPTREQVERAHQAGKRVIVVGPTVAAGQPENWRRVAAAGADAMLTDEPLEVRQALR